MLKTIMSTDMYKYNSLYHHMIDFNHQFILTNN